MDINLDNVYDEVMNITLDASSVTLDASSVALDASSVALDASDLNSTCNNSLVLPDKNININIIKNTLISEFKDKVQFIDKTLLFNMLIRCIELMKNTNINQDIQCRTALEIIIHILETNTLNVTTPPRPITILALKHDIDKLYPLLNKIQEVMFMVDTLHSTLQSVLHAYLSA